MADTTVMFDGHKKIQARAMFISQRLELRAFENMEKLSANPLIVKSGKEGVAVLFRYGVVVCFGMHAAEITAFFHDIQIYCIEPYEQPEWDAIELRLDTDKFEGIEGAWLNLHAFDLPRIQVVADVLAKSIVLGHYEIVMREQIERIEPFARTLTSGRRSPSGRTLMRHIGDTLMIESKMLGRVEISEKPELIWDYPEFERLYLKLADEYELRERNIAVERKLTHISRTAETLLDILHTGRSLRVE